MVAHSAEFENVVVRDEEMPELEVMARKCPINVKGGVENKIGKVSAQSHPAAHRTPQRASTT